MKRWLALLCLTALLIAQCTIGPVLSVASDGLMLGDIDGDGNVSMKDVLNMRRYIAHLGELAIPEAADVNSDQSVDMRDVLLIRKLIAHLIDSFSSSPLEIAFDEMCEKMPTFRYGYEQLKADEKAAYLEVVKTVRANLTTETTAHDGALGLTVSFSSELPDEYAVACVFRAIYADHPEYYFLCNDYSYVHTPEGQVTALLLHYFMDAKEREQAGVELFELVNEWIAALPAGTSATNKEITLHDRLCNIVTYPSGNGPYDDICYSPYGALVKGSAICDGYARALQLLLLAAQINTTVVEGFDEQGATHMWDVVYLAGDPYYVDPTWNDTTIRPTHAYFNVTTKDLAPSHTMNFWFPIPPTCAATKYNYYRYRGLYITSTDGSDYANLLAAARKNKESCFEARFAPTAMSANRRLTESGHLCDMVNEILPADVSPLSGYAYSFYDGMNVIYLAF